MTQQKAKVTRILDGGRAEVAVRRQSACSHDCSKCGGGCSELAVEPEIRVLAENGAGARMGDTVTVESDTADILGAAVLVYVMPFVLFFAGYFLAGLLLQAPEGVCVTTGVAGFALGFLLAWMLDRHRRRQRRVRFRIVAVEQAG